MLNYYIKVKKIVGVGTIDIRQRSQRETVLYRLRNKSHLKSIVLPIFDKYPMFSNKQYDYLMFKELLLKEIHLSKDLSDYIRPTEPLNSIETILNKSFFGILSSGNDIFRIIVPDGYKCNLGIFCSKI
jgi:hypothetical protein